MAKQSTKPAKGTRDFLADDVRRREHVIGVVRDVYRSYGFEPLETPSFERLDTLLGKYGDEGDQLVFKILHRGQNLVNGIRAASEALAQPGVIQIGRAGETAPSVETTLSDLGLRYDLTVPLARVVAQHGSTLPSVYRRYQIQPVWRADTPSKARFREFYQCDVDVVGSTAAVVEVEVASAISEVLERLGFDAFDVQLNHRGLLRAAMRVAGVPADLEVPAIIALDKLDKVGADGVASELRDKGVSEGARSALLDVLTPDASLDAVAAFVERDPEGAEACVNLRAILELAHELPAGRHLRFTSTLARGLGYYTGAIFEVQVADLGASMGGGGRYDGLVGMFSGKQVPACGFSLGLERILVVMEERGLFPERDAARRVLVAPTRAEQAARAARLAHAIRGASRREVELSPDPMKPGAARKSADDRGFGFAVLVDDDADTVNVWSREDPKVRDRRVPPAKLDAALG